MCGITGYLSSRDDSVEDLRRHTRRMCDAIAHRGPDDEGLWLDAERRVVLGHRRLAIVDLSPWGHQPMRRGDRLWAVYNGEVYNHLELRTELESLGHRFASHSDTEVLLAAYEQWGPDALQRCNGMWSLVILDTARRRLFVARDRFGVKPLYVWRGDDGALLLASEIKALLVHPRVRAAADLQACAEFQTPTPKQEPAR